jgi:3-isopropylmalate dehydratase
VRSRGAAASAGLWGRGQSFAADGRKGPSLGFRRFATGPRTLYDKVFDDHIVSTTDDGTALLYIDRHLCHEVTSPQAFEGLHIAGRPVRRPDCTLATVDHNIPTTTRKKFKNIEKFIKEEMSRQQVMALERNVELFQLPFFGMQDKRQGIVHIIGPEQGFTLPATTCVCGDSHTATHGAFGALAFGIGTSEVEHVLATATLSQKRSKNMLIRVDNEIGPGVTSKDIVLHICGIIGTAGGTGYTIEFAGSAIRALSMEARMSISNMAIEAGARAGMIAPDEITFEYLRGRPMVPPPDSPDWEAAKAYWLSLHTDEGAKFDKEVIIDGRDIPPTVTWGTSPQDTVAVTGVVPNPEIDAGGDEQRKKGIERALNYMGLEDRIGDKMTSIEVNTVFIGSCTNGRIEDIRSVASIVKGEQVKDGVRALVVPGSGMVKEQAEEEGLDKVLIEAGMEWREPGCSMCLGMNPDTLNPYDRCASTSNRNFEGRQGDRGRTHLLSPMMAAAAALTGRLTDVREMAIKEIAEPTQSRSGAYGKLHEKMYSDAQESAGPIIREASSQGDATGMPEFVNWKGIAAPLDIQNIDTDMIIPKQYLKTIKRTGLGYAAFAELRYKNSVEVAAKGPEVGIEIEDFVLNMAPYRTHEVGEGGGKIAHGNGAKIIVAGDNFGCGSSREHAPWAINGMGIRCIISTSFADIFNNNCYKNGMLPVKLPLEAVRELMADAVAQKEIEIDLPNQVVIRESGEKYPFEVDAFKKHCLINGLDDIGLTMQKLDEIRAFEAMRSKTYPWLDGATTRVPKLFPVKDLEERVSSGELDGSATPGPEQWRAEARGQKKMSA